MINLDVINIMDPFLPSLRPPAYPGKDEKKEEKTELTLVEKFQKIVRRYEIRTDFSTSLRKIVQDKKDVMNERKLLILTFSDGEPTTCEGKIDPQPVRQILLHRNPINKVYPTFIDCTHDEKTMEYLTAWHKKIP